MASKVIVHKNRTNILTVSMGMDVSDDTITSEIRAEPDLDSPLIAEWQVAYKTDGVDGELILTLDDFITKEIKANSGYMDIKRIVDGEPYAVFDMPLEVSFRGTVTQ